jgi:hypothetical protein
VRAPQEPVDEGLARFTTGCLTCSASRSCTMVKGNCLSACLRGKANSTWDCFLAFAWRAGWSSRLVTPNYAPHQSQCYVRLIFTDIEGSQWRLLDQMGDGRHLQSCGLYLRHTSGETSVFALIRKS